MLTLSWTFFDGGARKNNLAQAEANVHAAEAQARLTRDQIADEVWTAYSNLNTAFRQRQAATALLEAASQSYAAAESYKYGVRSLLDVTAAQRTLAQARSTDDSGAYAGPWRLGRSGFPNREFDSSRRENTMTPSRKRRGRARLGWIFAALPFASCARAPSFDILGSFFPAWLVCLTLAVLLTALARWLLLRLRHCGRIPNSGLSRA